VIILIILFGFSGGIVVGSGVVALLTLLGIVPRICQVSNTLKYFKFYELILIIGCVLGSIFSLFKIRFSLDTSSVIISGITYGIFIGFLSSSLAEVLDYIPVVSRRLKIAAEYTKYIIFALLIGKTLGSFLGWTVFIRR
jgi:stage V sporulation protein AB